MLRRAQLIEIGEKVVRGRKSNGVYRVNFLQLHLTRFSEDLILCVLFLNYCHAKNIYVPTAYDNTSSNLNLIQYRFIPL